MSSTRDHSHLSAEDQIKLEEWRKKRRAREPDNVTPELAPPPKAEAQPKKRRNWRDHLTSYDEVDNDEDGIVVKRRPTNTEEEERIPNENVYSGNEKFKQDEERELAGV